MNSSTAATPAKMARMRYSLRMNVFAPALISADTSRMVRFSTGWRLTHRWRYTANASAITTEKNETQ